MGFPDDSMVKNPSAVQESQEMWVCFWVRKIPWRRVWQTTPVFLTRGSHEQGTLVGYSPYGHKKLDRTEVT